MRGRSNLGAYMRCVFVNSLAFPIDWTFDHYEIGFSEVVLLKDSLPMQKRQMRCTTSHASSFKVLTFSRDIVKRMKERHCVVKRLSKSPILALHCPTTGHAFNYTSVLILRKAAPSTHMVVCRGLNKTPLYVKQCTTKALDLKHIPLFFTLLVF